MLFLTRWTNVREKEKDTATGAGERRLGIVGGLRSDEAVVTVGALVGCWAQPWPLKIQQPPWHEYVVLVLCTSLFEKSTLVSVYMYIYQITHNHANDTCYENL